MKPSRRIFMAMGASALTLTLAGCFTATPPLTYDLGSTSAGAIRRRSSRTVVITQPLAVQTYDSQRVVVREPGNILSYLPDAQLADTLPRLVQTRMLQTFEASKFPNIGRPDDQLTVDVTLATEITAFEIDVAKGNVASVTINAKLVDEERRQIFASKTFSASKPATLSPTSSAIMALDDALKDVMSQILLWTARTA
ncbi:MAG TPA: ABC-type transport auxiliary lipoprotein family protein [Devosiaceae bacterium]|jgi:cholesterol transport system auxiliary component